MRHSLLAAIAILAAAPPLASAQALGVEPGLWRWSYTATLVGLPIEDSGRECVSAEEAGTTMQDLADGLRHDCRVSDIARDGEAIRFRLTCSGEISGEADGVYRISGGAASLELDGVAGPRTMAERAPFRLRAHAHRMEEGC